ncbi:MAG: 2-amino-4-hydroxy-6-hydroxymethyldihydropteridine diphosphokinase, partial [Comamonas sp.]|nr:2-amino-4-hydroxy-6-hydroxymethyldihydropteridine diphosphokinase [Candidatus Comamonas equi]
MSELVYVGLGANLGDRGEALLQALQRMAALPQTKLRAVSSLYSSAPVDATGPDYLNAVAVLATKQAPLDFLQAL